MDNRTIDIVSQGREHLMAALSIVFNSHTTATYFCEFRLVRIAEGESAYDAHSTGFREDPAGVPTLILSSGLINGYGQKAMFPMDLEASVNNAMGWLANVEYAAEPGIDGHCKKGWRAFTEAWGHVFGSYNAIVAIQPAWALYGK